MNIVVCMKETPSTTAEKKMGEDMRLERKPADAIINPFDEYTVEEGLRQQEKHGGEVTILTMGPSTTTDTIRKALAMGAHKGVLVTDPAIAGSDIIGTARVLAAALRKITFDLVLFGSSSADAYGGVVPSAVAEFLGLPLLSFATKLDIEGDTATILRQAEDGEQKVQAKIPALVSVVKSINEPRYPSMKGIMQSKMKPITTMSLADLGVEAGHVGTGAAREKVLAFEKVSTQRKGEIFIGNDGAAQRVVAFLGEMKVL